MATTNEDATVLATLRLGDGRVLAARQLSDRGTIEITFWRREEGALVQEPPALEIAAELGEVAALQRLCEAAAAVPWESAANGRELAPGIVLDDGASLRALRSGDDLVLARQPDRDDLLRLPRTELDRLTGELLPGIAHKLAALGPAQR
jgi:hypothetical protein